MFSLVLLSSHSYVGSHSCTQHPLVLYGHPLEYLSPTVLSLFPHRINTSPDLPFPSCISTSRALLYPTSIPPPSLVALSICLVPTPHRRHFLSAPPSPFLGPHKSPKDLANTLVSVSEPVTSHQSVGAPAMIYDILLAEDNMVNQLIAVKLLEKHGHCVEIAENGQLAVDAVKERWWRSKPYDVILMDVSMPFMGGIEATQLIRAFESEQDLARTPIVALAVHGVVGDLECCLHAGMDDRITKPLRRADLINAISKVVRPRPS